MTARSVSPYRQNRARNPFRLPARSHLRLFRPSFSAASRGGHAQMSLYLASRETPPLTVSLGEAGVFLQLSILQVSLRPTHRYASCWLGLCLVSNDSRLLFIQVGRCCRTC